MGITREEAYEILGVPFGADQEIVRTKYKQLALKWHPDKHQNSTQATQKFQEISTAYKKLTESENDSDDEIEMSMHDMFELFQHIFFGRFAGYSNGYEYSDDDDDDDDYDDDDDDEDFDYMNTYAQRLRAKHDLRKNTPNSTGYSNASQVLTPEEIEKNANELITEEEKEKRRAEKRRAKKKRRREKKKMEKQQAEQTKKEDTKQSNKQKQNGTVEPGKSRSNKKNDKKRNDSSGSEEEFDTTAAFFTKVMGKKKKTGVPETAPQKNGVSSSGGRSQKAPGGKEESAEELDPIVLRSRQLAIRGNEMANQGEYNAAIDLFTEAIKLDPKDFRFFGNRSYCYDRTQQYDRALRDAEKAISLAPDWPKGYFRKGRALAGLKQNSDSEQAFMQVLKLDKNCEDALQELQRVRSQQLIEMGFSSQQAESAIRKHGSVSQALDSLLSGVAENNLSGEVYVSDDEDYSATLPSTRVNSHHTAPIGRVPQQSRAPTIPSRPAPHTTAGAAPSQRVPATNTTTSNIVTASRIPGQEAKMDPLNPEGLTALWVGNVLPEVPEKKLTQMFSKYGSVTSVRCLPEKYCAFINFKTKESAGKAMNNLQGVECGGQRLLIKFPDNPINGTHANSQGNVVIRKGTPNTNNTASASKSSKPTQSSYGPDPIDTDKKSTGPVNGDECYFWRTTGCHYGNGCHYKHIPHSKGVDRKPWQKSKAEQ